MHNHINKLVKFKNNRFINNLSTLRCSLALNTNSHLIGIADTGTTKSMIPPKKKLKNIHKSHKMNVVMPDNVAPHPKQQDI